VERLLLLTCIRCREAKLILVAVSPTGRLGPAKCDDCKRRDLMGRIGPRRAGSALREPTG